MDKTHNENPHLYWEQQPDGRWVTIDPSCDPEADRDMQELADLLGTIKKLIPADLDSGATDGTLRPPEKGDIA